MPVQTSQLSCNTVKLCGCALSFSGWWDPSQTRITSYGVDLQIGNTKGQRRWGLIGNHSSRTREPTKGECRSSTCALFAPHWKTLDSTGSEPYYHRERWQCLWYQSMEDIAVPARGLAQSWAALGNPSFLKVLWY